MRREPVEITTLDKNALIAWLAKALTGSRLATGQINPPFAIDYGRVAGTVGWDYIATAQSPDITIEALQAASHDSFDDLLRTEPEAARVVREVERLSLLTPSSTAISAIVSSPRSRRRRCRLFSP